MSEWPRCPKCQYALVRGVCPIGGRQVSDRLPMVAPLPVHRAEAKPLPFRKPKRRRSA